MRRAKGRKRKKIILICMLCLAPIILFVASYFIFKLTLPNKITIEVGSNLEPEYSTNNITLTTDEGNKVNTEKIGSYKGFFKNKSHPCLNFRWIYNNTPFFYTFFS